MSFPANNSKKYVQKVKVLSLCLYSFIKWYDLTWPCNSPKFNLYHQQKISTGFKMVVLTSKFGMGIPLHTKFLLTKYFKSSHYWRKTVMVANRPQWLVSDSYMSQKLSGLHSKPRFQNSQCYSKSVAVICIYFTHMSLSSFQNNFRSPSIHFLIVAYPKYV